MTKAAPTVRQSHVDEILARLIDNYPDAQCSLDFVKPHELLVSTILSAQCTDKQVNKVTPALFRKYPTPQAFAEADSEELKEMIRPTGFFNNKAKSIRNAMRAVVTNFNGRVPDTLEELLQLEGVGRKTANVVLGDAFGTPGIVVDTHVKRIARRLGLTENNDPVRIEFDLMALIPEEHWTLFGHLIIDHGRAICQARKPRCQDCFLHDICPSAKP